jgi:phage N-6-adenine-methyltransferase
MMAEFKTKFNTGKQDWETPESIFDPLNREFCFNLDVCAIPSNTKCEKYFTPEQNGLNKKWRGMCWMNPPFGQQSKWVKKAYEESQNGATVVCLLPARTNTNWWHDYCMKGEIRFIRGRPKFKGAKHGLPQPLAIIIFGIKRGVI